MRSRVSASLALNIAMWLSFSLVYAQASSVSPAPARFAPPPVSETDTIGKLIDESEALLKTGASVSTVLSSAKFDAARAWPRFRNAVRQAARAETLTLVSPTEAGSALLVNGRVVDASGAGLGGALLYVYHTDARGLYAENAIHVGGDSGDWKHARLFGYLRTNANGEFQLRTIRPGGYPGSDLPQHIHLGIEHEKFRHTTEIGLDDDPRLSPLVRSRFQLQGNLVARVARTERGETAAVEVVLRR